MSSLSPVAILYNADGTAAITITNGAALPSGIQALVVAGSDGTNLRFIKTANDGTVRTDPTGTTTQPVSGPLTDAQLRATAVPVSGTFWPGTQPVSAASLPLPTGAATETTLASINTKTPALGQAAMAASQPVVIASNQSAVPVSMAASGYGGQVEGRAADGSTPVGNPVLFGGSDGTNTQTILTDNLGRIITAPSGAGANVAGFALGTMVTTAITDVPVRATTYTEPAVNAQRSLSSASANDTAAGTGARQVRITYLDATGAGPFTETVTLNGTTAVATVATNICFIERMEVVSVGSTGSNVGIITLFVNAAGGGGTIGTIAATTNRTFWAHHYTPTSKSSFITSMAGNNTNTSNVTVLSVRAKVLAANTLDVIVSDYVAVGGPTAQESRTFGTAIQVTGPARLTLYGAPAGTPSITTRASFDYYDQ